jgi:hypothetical protein
LVCDPFHRKTSRMRAPLCICNGVIRSGSTWSFNVCRELYQQLALHLKHGFGSAYLDSGPLEHFIAQQWQSVNGSTVIKAHDLGPTALAAVRAGKAKAVCTFRDPRDCVASDVKFMKYPFEVCVKRVSGTLEPLRIFQTTPHILLVRYEDMMADRPREIRRIAAHLGLNIPDELVHQIDAKTNPQTSSQVCANLKHKSNNEVLKVADHRVDPATQLHENHLNGGIIGRWRDELSGDHVSYMNEFFAPWLIKLGYETPQSLAAMLNNSQDLSESVRFAQPMPFGAFSVDGGSARRFAGSLQ